LIAGIQVNADAMRAAAKEGFATATDLADYLVRKGLAFRDAHEAVARAVRFAEKSGWVWSSCRSRRCAASPPKWKKTSTACSRSRLGREPLAHRRHRPGAVRAAISRARKLLKADPAP